MQHVLTGLLLQFPPQGESATQQRDVAGVFEVGQTNDSRETVRGSAIVAGLELLDGNHRESALREVIGDSASHAANPKDDNVIHLCHGVSLRVAKGRRSR